MTEETAMTTTETTPPPSEYRTALAAVLDSHSDCRDENGTICSACAIAHSVLASSPREDGGARLRALEEAARVADGATCSDSACQASACVLLRAVAEKIRELAASPPRSAGAPDLPSKLVRAIGRLAEEAHRLVLAEEDEGRTLPHLSHAIDDVCALVPAVGRRVGLEPAPALDAHTETEGEERVSGEALRNELETLVREFEERNVYDRHAQSDNNRIGAATQEAVCRGSLMAREACVRDLRAPSSPEDAREKALEGMVRDLAECEPLMIGGVDHASCDREPCVFCRARALLSAPRSPETTPTDAERWRNALELIASCTPVVAGDVISIARLALSGRDFRAPETTEGPARATPGEKPGCDDCAGEGRYLPGDAEGGYVRCWTCAPCPRCDGKGRVTPAPSGEGTARSYVACTACGGSGKEGTGTPSAEGGEDYRECWRCGGTGTQHVATAAPAPLGPWTEADAAAIRPEVAENIGAAPASDESPTTKEEPGCSGGCAAGYRCDGAHE